MLYQVPLYRRCLRWMNLWKSILSSFNIFISVNFNRIIRLYSQINKYSLCWSVNNWSFYCSFTNNLAWSIYTLWKWWLFAFILFINSWSKRVSMRREKALNNKNLWIILLLCNYRRWIVQFFNIFHIFWSCCCFCLSLFRHWRYSIFFKVLNIFERFRI